MERTGVMVTGGSESEPAYEAWCDPDGQPGSTEPNARIVVLSIRNPVTLGQSHGHGSREKEEGTS